KTGKDIYAATAGIRLRGNSTMLYDKKPYRIKFSKKQNPFDLGKSKSWTLIANYLDPAFIRNEVAYAFTSRLNQMTAETRPDQFLTFCPRMVTVEVYLNGEYRGLYDFCDHIQAADIRVNVDLDEDEDGNVLGTLDTGYFIEVEDESRVLPEYESEGTPYFTVRAGGSKEKIYLQFKLPEEPTPEQINYIQSYMQNVSDLIMARNPEVWNYLDMDSVIDWYLVNELFKNTDSNYLSSCYLFKDKEGLLRMGPVWDFDLSAGAVAYGNMSDPTGWRTRNKENVSWFADFFAMSDFTEAFNARWAKLHETGVLDQIFTDIDEREVSLNDAASRNYEMWQASYVNAVKTTGWLSVMSDCLDPTRWEEQLQYVRSYMRARIAWLDTQFGYAEQAEEPATSVALLSEAVTASRTTTVNINKSFNVKELSNLYLSVSSTGSFDITFNFNVGSPKLSTDWKGTDASKYPFVGQTGTAINAGTYTNAELNLTEFMPYSSSPDATFITLESITIAPSGSSRPGQQRSVTVSALYAAAEPQQNVGAATIDGTLAIRGIPEYGVTVWADTLAVANLPDIVSYQWYRNGEAISGATSESYRLTSTDIGTEITLKLSSSSGSLTSDPITIKKAKYTYQTTQIPMLVSKTSDTIVIESRTGYQYRIDGRDWQDETTFENLSPNTFYRVYYRHGETANQQGGLQGYRALYVITDPVNAPEHIGDVNGDDVVNSSDVKVLLKHLLGSAELTGASLANADTNNDGRVDSTDARMLLDMIVDG
ncbi:MAG: CotH kinase family protein, partial [Clostridia bacterium]|nr:CotH kinase family protein [Clostridia bacterium]